LGEPGAAALVKAAADFFEREAQPLLSGHAAFHGRVALNALAIVARELSLGPETAAREAAGWRDHLGTDETDLLALRRAACAAIRAGALGPRTPGLIAFLTALAAARVRIEQPNYASLARAPDAPPP
jgi:hypothetical protein